MIEMIKSWERSGRATLADLVESTETVSGRDDPPPVEERPAALYLLLSLQDQAELHHPGPVEGAGGQTSLSVIDSNIATLTVTLGYS